jgi:hypothetical protein
LETPKLQADAQHLFKSFPFWSFVKFQLVLCLSVSGAFAQTKSKIIHIPTPTGSTSSALGLNENGQIIGYSFQGEDYQRSVGKKV